MSRILPWAKLFICFSYLLLPDQSIAEISQSPLFYTTPAQPIVMLTMGRDHKLYFEAYNDASDLDGDGVLDTHYKPLNIDYYGYFDSYKCYTYDTSAKKFTPSSKTTTKKCTGQWSGDFLNYVTTSRMDALRKVLYGGYRSTDTTTQTILQRAYIPQDAHSWGKEYTSVDVDGYHISDYTPLTLPISGTRHFFASTTVGEPPNPTLLRVLQNKSEHIWQWASKEALVVDTSLGVPTDYQVKVDVCISETLKETNCKAYVNGSTTALKPTGLLQNYGEAGLMDFGLLTGSYQKNISGGVLRKNIAPFRNEIDPLTGILQSNGIVDTINRLRVETFHGSTYSSGWIGTRPINEGEAPEWGNPIAEMMYETLRYFAGKGTPTAAFSTGVNGTGTPDYRLGLPLATWQDPYGSTGGRYPSCSKPMQLVISDINPSYDTDQLPGSWFNSSFSGDLTGLNVSTLADTIWANEGEASTIFIGQSNNTSDGAPTAKPATSFKNIRGLAPEEPTKMGGYYSASVAYYGRQTDLHATASNQKVETMAVALASPLPRIELPVNGKTITLVPFAKSVGGCIVNGPAQNLYHPTDQIVDFYVEQLVNTNSANINLAINSGRPYGVFRINFEDMEQAADYDMDAIVQYTVKVNANNQLEVTLSATYASGCIIQHVGYVISGTTADGTYLEVKDLDTGAGSDVDFFLDTPPNKLPGAGWQDATALPYTTTRTFTAGTSNSASFTKHDPLWYAAKWGSSDKDDDGVLDLDEWDSDNNGSPDNYFLVTNAGNLERQLAKAFAKLSEVPSSGAAVAANVARLDTQTLIYQAIFISKDWSGDLLAMQADNTGAINPDRPTWKVSDKLLTATNRANHMFTFNPDKPLGSRGVLFDWASLNTSQQTYLNTNSFLSALDNNGQLRLAWLQGDQSKEIQNGGNFRNRTNLLGDIIHSSPAYVSKQNYGYSALPSPMGGAYTTFVGNNASRTPMIYTGANDGMLHGFDASISGGTEKLAFIPNAAYPGLSNLSSPLYQHQYFVDGEITVGDVYADLNNTGTASWRTLLVGAMGAGGKDIFAIDVTDPNQFSANSILWELSNTNTGMEELGYTLTQASIGLVSNADKWAVIMANGYNGASGKAVLYILDAKTGSVIHSFDTSPYDETASPAAANGLSSPLAVDTNNDLRIDTIYAGDLHGNLWKFDVSDSDPTRWKIANSNKPLFVACTTDTSNCPTANRQPITTKPNIALSSSRDAKGTMVYFGTGKYFEVGDNLVDNNHPQQMQSFYGLSDKGSVINNRNKLQKQTIDFQGFANNSSGTHLANNKRVRGMSKQKVCYSTSSSCAEAKNGWVINLMAPGLTNSEGERVTGQAIVNKGLVVFVSFTPSYDPCVSGGISWPFFVDAQNGGTPAFVPVDVSGDNKVDQKDLGLVGGSTVNVVSFELNGIVNKLSSVGGGSGGDGKTEKTHYYYSSSTGNTGKNDGETPLSNPLKSWRQLR